MAKKATVKKAVAETVKALVKAGETAAATKVATKKVSGASAVKLLKAEGFSAGSVALITGKAAEPATKPTGAVVGPDSIETFDPLNYTEADMAKGKKAAAAKKGPKAGAVVKVKGSEKLQQPKPGVAAKKADTPAPVPCSKCGRQNPQNADCRIPSACQRRVRKAKEAAKAAAAPAAPKPATAKEASL